MAMFETYLITPPLTDAEAFRAPFLAAITALTPASVLLALPEADERTQINLIKALAPLAQEAQVAVLVNTAAHVAVRGGADGVHVAGAGLVTVSRETLKGDRIVGAGGLTSRHDAMDAGEAGADYVMFGEPRGDGSALSLSALVERATWWAELFETPCVAYAADPAAIEPLALTRAEFLALGPWCFADLTGAAKALTEAREVVASTRRKAAPGLS
jgi:thiamine-phosphate pyrophosphorylase